MDDLLSYVTPEVYQKNLFRLLSLPLTATVREVQRLEARRQMQARLGVAEEAASESPFPLRPQPDGEATQAALERLHSPPERFMAELFWFWPQRNGRDAALDALIRGQTDDAVKQWTRQLDEPGRETSARHNLAVLFHLLALDDEAALGAGDQDRGRATRLQTEWQRAQSHWQALLDSDGFWRELEIRATAHADARLGSDTVEAIRGALPTALIAVNATLAFRAAERDDTVSLARHLRILGATGADLEVRHRAIRQALRPWDQQIRDAVAAATNNWTRVPQEGNQAIRNLHRTAARTLAIIDRVLLSEIDEPKAPPKGAKHTQRNNDVSTSPFNFLSVGLHDLVADAMLDGQILFGKKTDDWKESAQLLELAAQVACGDALKEKLAENIKIVKGNGEGGNDWCAPGYWQLQEADLGVLEAAKARVDVGDFDGALSLLVPLDPERIGRPLKRAAACCLSLSAVRAMNAAISEYNLPTPTQRKLIERVKNDITLIMRRPDPSTPAWQNPPCPLCGSSLFTSWTNFTHNGLPLWYCQDHRSTVSAEIETQKKKLASEISAAWERLKLALEIDPGEIGVKRNLEVLVRQAKEVGVAEPSTAGLRAKLDRQLSNPLEEQVGALESATPRTCYFCGDARETLDHGISVALTSDGEVGIARLLGRRKMLKIGHAIVPRCGACHSAHIDLMKQHSDWCASRKAVKDQVDTDCPAGRRLEWIKNNPNRFQLYRIAAGLSLLLIIPALTDGLSSMTYDSVMHNEDIGYQMLSAVSVITRLSGLIYLLYAIFWYKNTINSIGDNLLALAKRRAVKRVRAWEASNPQPKLPPSVKPEDSWSEWPDLRRLQKSGWRRLDDGKSAIVTGVRNLVSAA